VGAPESIGKYRIQGVLGRGAMGIVYRGRDDSLDRDVAVKVLAASDADADVRARFEREAKAVARLQHPNIVTIYELGEHQGSPYMAMELLDGLDLQQALQAGYRPDPKAALPIVLQLLAGLGHAHDHGIVHRDMKPSNVFLPRKRPTKIMDFGVARLGAGMKTRTGLVVGTPSYMSPEQARAQPVDGRSDLFSVALILYELLTGERLFQGDSMIAVVYRIAHEDVDLSELPRDKVSDRLKGILARGLSREREARYADAPGMAAELQQALTELGGVPDWTFRSDVGLQFPAPVEPTAVAPPAAPPVASRPGQGPPWKWVVAGTSALTILAAGYLLGVRGRQAPDGTPPPVTVTSPSATSSASAPVSTQAAPPAKPTASPRVSPSVEATTSSSPAPTEPTTPPAGQLERASAFLEQGRYASALQEARAVLEREPGNAQARTIAEDAEAALMVETRLKNARDALRRNDRDTALAEVRAGLAVSGNDARLLALFRELTQ
jgi:serine/threonine-protein kinase